MSDASWFVHELSCPNCAGDLQLVSKSAPDIYHSSFVCTCPKCKRDMVVKVNLVVLYHPSDDKRTDELRLRDRTRKRNERAKLAMST